MSSFHVHESLIATELDRILWDRDRDLLGECFEKICRRVDPTCSESEAVIQTRRRIKNQVREGRRSDAFEKHHCSLDHFLESGGEE